MGEMGVVRTFRSAASVFAFDESNVKYWMYLVIHKLFEAFTPIDPFIQLISNFGDSAGEKAMVTIPYNTSYSITRQEILSVDWDNDVREKIKKMDVFLLILDIPFYCSNYCFNPSKDKFIIMDFPEAAKNPLQYIYILDEIADEIKRGTDIFEWHSKEWKPIPSNKILKHIYKAIEAKPGIFGFSIDLKKLLTTI
jgi:hypothetical protein